MTRKTRPAIVLVASLLALAAAGGLTVWALAAAARWPFRGYAGTEQFVEIAPGSGSRTIGDRLVAAGVVRNHWTFRFAVWMTGQGRHLKAGEYRFDHPLSATEVIDKIARGDVFVIPVTFPEGLTIVEMAGIFEARGFGPASAFIEASKDVTPIRALDPSARDLEGYLFPETYLLPRHTDASKLVRLMVGQFERVMTPELRQAAAARGLSLRDTMTLASIVEKETARPEERPLVAAVYENRLRLGMLLQCDPTVIYGLERAGRYDGNLTRQSLAFDSPYNTYRYPGLPPGPIASPGRTSIEAAVHPTDLGFLYFVSRNDGTHEFARTLEEHNRNVQKFQVRYFQQKHSGRQGPIGR